MQMKKNGKKRNRMYRILLGLLETIFVLSLLVGLAGIYFYKSGEMALKASAETHAPVMETDLEEEQRVRSAYEENTQKTLTWQDNWIAYEGEVYEYNEDCLNFLIMGIDRSGRLDRETDLSDWSAGQADTIFLVSLNNRDKTVSIIGIPRNSMVHLDIYNEKEECIDTIYNQICLQYGYAGGGELGLEKMKSSVSDLFYQLPIHGACAVSYDAIGIITDKLGGLEVTVQDDMTAYHKDYTVGSKVTLTGKNVIPYLRYRNNSELGSPTTRLTRQKAFLQTAIYKAVEEIKRNPAFISEIYEAIIPYMNTDITLDKAVYLASESIDYSISDSSFYQLTGEDKKVDFEKVKSSADFYDDFYLDEEALKKNIMTIFYQKVQMK